MTDKRRTSPSKGALTLDNAYKFYKQSAKSIPENLKITKKLYRDICKDYNKDLVESVVSGSIEALPGNMGEIRIKKFQVNLDLLMFDYGHYNKTGEKIFHDNWHSDGFGARWMWHKHTRRLKNLVLYNFAPTFTNKEKVASSMKEKGGHKKYFE